MFPNVRPRPFRRSISSLSWASSMGCAPGTCQQSHDPPRAVSIPRAPAWFSALRPLRGRPRRFRGRSWVCPNRHAGVRTASPPPWRETARPQTPAAWMSFLRENAAFMLRVSFRLPALIPFWPDRSQSRSQAGKSGTCSQPKLPAKPSQVLTERCVAPSLRGACPPFASARCFRV